MPDAVIHGVMDASGRVAHLQTAVPVTPELLASTYPLRPTEVLRFSAPCAGGSCVHFANDACSLGERLVTILPAAPQAVVPCAIRAGCRWFAERGRAACARCDAVVTDAYARDAEMERIATPAPN